MAKVYRRSIEKIFNMIWKEAEKILEEWNPCQINCEMGTCTQGCEFAREKNSEFKNFLEKEEYTRAVSFCCNGCKYLGPRGCTVQCLSCKLWLCETARKLNPAAFEKLKVLRTAMDKWFLGSFRSSKEDAIEYAYQILNRKELK